MTAVLRCATARPVPAPVIRSATCDEAGGIAVLIAIATLNLPCTCWLIPDCRDRHRILPGYFRIFVDQALQHGLVEVTEDLNAAALWLPGPQPSAVIGCLDERLLRVCGCRARRFRYFHRILDSVEPAGPHHQLALLAVRPRCQGLGLGGALLRHHLRALDEVGVPACTTARGPRDRHLGLRTGFVPHRHALRLPAGGPSLWPMWRAVGG